MEVPPARWYSRNPPCSLVLRQGLRFQSGHGAADFMRFPLCDTFHAGTLQWMSSPLRHELAWHKIKQVGNPPIRHLQQKMIDARTFATLARFVHCPDI